MGANCQIEQQAGGKVVIKAEASPPSLTSACSNMSIAEKDSKGMTNHRLLVAARDNDVEGIKKSLEQGAYLETRRPFVMRPKPPPVSHEASGKKRKAPKEGLTPLMYAAQNGSMIVTQMLIEARAQVQARDEDGVQPLHFAAAAASDEVCAFLMKCGADKDAADDEGRKSVDYVSEAELAAKADRAKWEALLGVSTFAGAPAAVTANGAPYSNAWEGAPPANAWEAGPWQPAAPATAGA